MTIVVALMLLVLLTIAAVAMSRNSLREIATSGFSRQGAMARNVADSGLEWSIHWMDLQNGALAPSNSAALKLTQLKATLLLDSTKAGTAWDVQSTEPASPSQYTPNATNLPLAALTLTAAGSATQATSLGLTYMGKLPVAGMSQGAGTGAFTPAAGGTALQAPDLWAVRADAQVTRGAVTFTHAKELWVSTPVR
ncbi:MAG: hypothetical protein WCL47_07225 [Holophagaceae bacterium]